MSMEACIARTVIALGTLASLGAVSRTPNFVIRAPTPDIAKQVGIAAEHYREKLSFEWLGKKFARRWATPCQITVRVGQIGAGGETKFSFHNGHVFGWKMVVQGSLERILDSVLPHEISHTIFACHFRRPLPRWADEGAATLAEHSSERLRQQRLAEHVLGSNRRIPLRELLTIQEYPRDMQTVFSLYAQGFSLADFLIQQGGKPRFLKFLEDAYRQGWDQAIVRHYRLSHVDALEQRWSAWIMAGSPSLKMTKGQLVASNSPTKESDREPALIIRSQTPERFQTSRDSVTNDAVDATRPARSSTRPLKRIDDSNRSIWRVPLTQPPRSRNKLPQASQNIKSLGLTMHKRPAAGRTLHAPDPRHVNQRVILASRLRSQFQPEQVQTISVARRKAIDDGWIPLAAEYRSDRSLD